MAISRTWPLIALKVVLHACRRTPSDLPKSETGSLRDFDLFNREPVTSAITCALIPRSSRYPGSLRYLVHQDRVVAEVGNEGFGDLGYRLVRASGRPVSDADQRGTTQVQGSLQGPSSPIGCPGIARDTCLRPGMLRRIGRRFTPGFLGSQEIAEPAHA